MPEQKYNPREIELKWQERWDKDSLYRTVDNDPRPKWYALTMFPYTSGDLHIGHWYAMAPSDTQARYKRMQGYNVLYPMGFDSFGLPAENAAIKRGIHPQKWTMDNIERMRKQVKSMGPMHDWSREIITCLPEYYRWNQWFFLQFYKKGIAYRTKAPVNWCPSCQTVLANEQVLSDGTCERCGTTVTHKELAQWFFKTTKYAEELLNFEGVEWPERIKTMQRNWIGRSDGVEASFGLDVPGVTEKEVRVFTTRVDTIFGVTFLVIAPEHPLVAKVTTKERTAKVQEYVEKARRSTDIERLATGREKTGVFTGAYVTNNFTNDRVPLFVADYVLPGYGTGAVMGVPAHDQRDFDFSKKYGLPIKAVIAPPEGLPKAMTEAYEDDGIMVNSGQFNGLSNTASKDAVAKFAEERRIGKRTVTYRLRDWLVSRQRYWGTPIPMIYCAKCGIVPVPESDLPIELPYDAQFKPTGESPLAYHEGFVNTTCPTCHGKARRETDTMDTFVDSSWYQFRYSSHDYQKAPFDPAKAAQWCPISQYTGGAEHANMHLLYARFFTKAARDLGLITFGEPFKRLFNQGIILGEDHEKMSKSRGNVVNPDEFVDVMGADAVRTFLMFVGPWDHGGSWSSEGLNGISRWLNRVWDLCIRDTSRLPESAPSGENSLLRITHKTIKRVTEDLDKFRFNTMVAAMMEMTNAMGRAWEDKSADRATWKKAIEALVLMLAPSTPHFAEELWEATGHGYSVHNQKWPTWDENLVIDKQITLVIQVNGKVRDRLEVPANVSEDEAKSMALASDKVMSHTKDLQVKTIVYVPGRLINIVVVG
ncbi:MAG: leucine--tRNA ligase [Dehalococcoidia bacterium]|nr:leucine--tRNA ligase [Dehalococcoidia bacterium]